MTTGRPSLRVRVPRATAGTAMVETAIVLPLYMLILLGLLYFGYATLSRQGQVKAAAYAAWMPERQQADTLLSGFWSWAGTPATQGAPNTNTTSATAWDQTLALNSREWASQADDYYYSGEVPTQLVGGVNSIAGPTEDIFSPERVAISLRTYATGEVTQYFEWVPGQGIQERSRIQGDSFVDYLWDPKKEMELGGAFIDNLDESALGAPKRDERRVVDALNGPGATHWLERRHAELDATYEPPFFQQIMREEGSAPSTVTQYTSGRYPGHVDAPSSRITFSLTGRSGSGRFAIGESGQTHDTLLQEVGSLLFGNGMLPSTTDFDNAVLIGSQTAKELWTPQ